MLEGKKKKYVCRNREKEAEMRHTCVLHSNFHIITASLSKIVSVHKNNMNYEKKIRRTKATGTSFMPI